MRRGTAPSLPRLVVLGCGFAGYSLLASLPRGRFASTLVSPRNHFLFTPLLPSAVTGAVEFRSIVEPARRRLRHTKVVEAAAVDIDWSARRLRCVAVPGGEELSLDYEGLVLAVGTEVADYGVPGVAEHALTLTSVADARRIRQRVLEQFARADLPGLSPFEIEQRLTFVVCGAGPTGVEVAAEISDLVGRELRRSFGGLADRARLVLIEAGERLLRSFDSALSAYTLEHFRREQIEVRLSAPVSEITAQAVHLASGEIIPCGLVIWAAGTRPVPLVRRLLGDRLEQSGRIPVTPDFRVPGLEAVWAVGDCAVTDPPTPATAQVAQQQGEHLARVLVADLEQRTPPAFRFRYQGMLAYIGGNEALADLPHAKWSGRGAWIFWRSVYLTKLVGVANKVKVLFDWIKATLFGRDLSRL
jgi:NADH:ubiquinone reductase (non-electrogenic)